MKSKREAIGAAIAYKIDWKALGLTTVMRAGGTIELSNARGEKFTVTVAAA